jgi:putative endonuclease
MTCVDGWRSIALEWARNSSNYKVTRLVYVETFDDPESAITREKRLKKWNRDWKIRLIEQDNLEWRDLSHLVG